MKIQLASDLHLEFIAKRFPDERLICPAPGADVLVLAGDIHVGTNAPKLFRDWPVPVVYLAGNHEFYGHEWQETRIALRRECVEQGIHFLDNDIFEYQGIRLVGSTLWTDFKLRGQPQGHQMLEAEQRMNDYYRIRSKSGLLRAEDTLGDHQRSVRWLREVLNDSDLDRTVVVTHHAPHALSINPKYVGDPVNAAFASDLTDLLFQTRLWLHGHTHDSCRYQVGRCQVVSNPAGYSLIRSQSFELADINLENSAFDPCMLIDFPGAG